MDNQSISQLNSTFKNKYPITEQQLNIKVQQLPDTITLDPVSDPMIFGSFLDCVVKMQFKQIQHQKQNINMDSSKIIDQKIFDKYKILLTQPIITDLNDMFILSQECGAKHGNNSWYEMPEDIKKQLPNLEINAKAFYNWTQLNGFTEQFIDTTYKLDDKYLGEHDILLKNPIMNEIIMVDIKCSKYRQINLVNYYHQLQMYSICSNRLNNIRPTKFMIYNVLYGTIYWTTNIYLYKNELQNELGFVQSYAQQYVNNQLKIKYNQFLQNVDEYIYELKCMPQDSIIESYIQDLLNIIKKQV